MVPEIEAGQLVRVRNSTTGDSPWVTDLYAKRTPVLVLQAGIGVKNTTRHCGVLYKGRLCFIEKDRLKVVSR